MDGAGKAGPTILFLPLFPFGLDGCPVCDRCPWAMYAVPCMLRKQQRWVVGDAGMEVMGSAGICLGPQQLSLLVILSGTANNPTDMGVHIARIAPF